MISSRQIKLRKGQRVRLPDGIFAVLRRLDHRVQLEHEETGELRTLSDFELGQLWVQADLSFVTGDTAAPGAQPAVILPDPAAYSVKIAKEVERRLAFVRGFGMLDRSRTLASAANFLQSSSSDLTAPSLDGIPSALEKPGPRTLLRWIAAARQAGTTAGAALVPSHHRKGNRGQRLNDRVEAMLTRAIEEVYLRRPRNSVADVFNELLEAIQKAVAAGESLKMPAASTIRRRIATSMVMRRWLPGTGSGPRIGLHTGGRIPEPERLLQVVQIDHTSLDIFVFDDVVKRRVLARATLTLAVDVFSRCVWGFHIGFDPPSYVAVMNCLWNGIRPKDGDLRRAGIEGDGWPCLGLPETIIVDNGKEFHSHALRHAGAMLGITIIYAPAGAPERKPHIERLVGTVNRSVAHRMPGTTFSNVRDKGDYKPEAEAVHDIGFLRARSWNGLRGSITDARIAALGNHRSNDGIVVSSGTHPYCPQTYVIYEFCYARRWRAAPSAGMASSLRISATIRVNLPTSSPRPVRTGSSSTFGWILTTSGRSSSCIQGEEHSLRYLASTQNTPVAFLSMSTVRSGKPSGRPWRRGHGIPNSWPPKRSSDDLSKDRISAGRRWVRAAPGKRASLAPNSTLR